MGLLSSFVLCLGSGPIPGGDHEFSLVSGQILVFSILHCLLYMGSVIDLRPI